ncbi:UV radiation resistance-associated gene protein isoform X2 [Teleopsis dalmanni]|uniref:UV radiation resistance-associated gene protein isoform X2 n=1 Tax=Teleopsis dalmanni TaxID=139649 RepID=UPI0018CED4FB|nr:UV radiation resistance-associated gene protein isoform X2 [Teleopsis dalmanni]
MNVRPRCREWIPLSTQQLRLRNLVQIQGQNIQCNIAGEVFIYYTLHSNKKSSAFYISESLPRQHSEHKWMDINCSEILKSNLNCVCVKVWAHIKDGKQSQNFQNEPESKRNELISALSKELSKCLSTNNLKCSPDEILFTWGVYFSGLIPLINQSDFKCVANSLIFLMNGVYFVSPANFAENGFREQLSHTIPTVSNLQIDSINSEEVKCCLDTSECETQKSQTNRRNTKLLCPTLDVRKSYSLDKLLKIQNVQREHMLATKRATDVVDNIKQISVRCITNEQLLHKTQTTSSTLRSATQVHHSIGRTLSVLLDEHKQIDHQTLIRAQVLQQKIEILHSRNTLLIAERAILSERICQRQERLCSILDSRQKQCKRLHSYNKKLCKDMEFLDKYNAQNKAQQILKERIMHNLQRRMSLLCTELRQIYPISYNFGFYTICGIRFPNMNNYLTDDNSTNNVCLDVSPMALSVCLGYIAHLVQMISVIINRPLRNPIIYKCSRSSIIDVKTLPYVSREKSRSVGSYSDSEDSRNSMEIASNCHYLSDSNISFKGEC